MGPDDVDVARYAEPGEEEALRAAVLARLERRRRRGFKTCSSCQEDKGPAAYRSDSSRRDGLARYCRVCEACKRTP